MVKPCFVPAEEAGCLPGSLRAKWRGLASMFHDLLGPELAQKFVNDVVWKDELGEVKVEDGSITDLSSTGPLSPPPWHGERIGTLYVVSGESEHYYFYGELDGHRLVLNWVAVG